MKKKEVIVIRIKDDLKKKAFDRADDLEMSLSEYLRNLIINDLNNKKNG